jgi:hypothetical protein
MRGGSWHYRRVYRFLSLLCLALCFGVIWVGLISLDGGTGYHSECSGTLTGWGVAQGVAGLCVLGFLGGLVWCFTRAADTGAFAPRQVGYLVLASFVAAIAWVSLVFSAWDHSKKHRAVCQGDTPSSSG